MPHIASLMPRVLATSLALVSFASIAWAQSAPTVRIRGTIEAVDGPVLAIKSREGTDMKVRSEERRVGKECPSLCRSRWSPYH